jgi:hypothetical protein
MISSQRFAGGLAGFTSLLVASAFSAPSALADTVKAEISTPLPTYQVSSNGSSYHQVQGSIGSAAFSVTADAEVAGQVTSVSYDALARATGAAGGPFVFTSQADARTFSGTFHKVESLVGAYQPSPAELVAACNNLADGLRSQGKSDSEIFGQDRQLDLTITVAPDASFSGPSGFSNAPQLVSETTSITCMEWAGAVGFAKPASITATDGVSDSHLTLIEQYGPSGMCEIILSGVITTTSANMEVRFQYEHFDGKKSEVRTVTTDHSKTAMFSHKYTVPNQDGPEGGSVKMVGVSPTFTSNTAAYSMDCSESGPTGIQAASLPEVSLAGTQTGQIEVGGQYCPTGLLLRGKIQGKGGNIAGQAFFVGPGYASPHHDYQVGGSQTVVIEDTMPLTWEAEPLQSFATGNAPPAAKSQTVTAGFNIMGTNNTEIANVPQRTFTVTCSTTPPPVGHGGGGFAAPSGVPASMPANPAMAVPANPPEASRPSRAAPGRQGTQTPAPPARTPPVRPIEAANPDPETAAPGPEPRAIPVPAQRSTPDRRAPAPEPATEADPPATPENPQQPQSGLLQHELTHTVQQGAGASSSRGGVQLQQRPSPANPALPEVDDEVLAALESGSYSVSGKYVVVAVRHRQPVRLREGAYRSKSGRAFRITGGRFIAGD